MQKKKARKGFLFLRRESVLPPCRAGPVCPAGTNAVFCGGTHGSRPTHLVIASQCSHWRGNPFPARQRRADGTSRTPSPTHSVIASQSAPRSKCPWGTDWRGNPFPHKGKDGFPRQCEHWLGMTARQSPLDKPGRMDIIGSVRGRCDKRSAP